jgi:hypothetical protein
MSWIKEEFQKLDQTPRALRKFGLMVGGVFLVLGALMVWRHRAAGWPFVSVGAVLVVLGGVMPTALKWVHTLWMIFALMLGWVVTRVLLTIVFYLVVTPVGMIQRLSGKSGIEVAFRDANVASYWQTRTNRFMPEDYEKQF